VIILNENIIRYKLTESVEVLRLLDSETKYFEALWEIPEGVVYNAYIVRGGSGVVLVDTWKVGYGGELVEILEETGVLDKLTHIITHHVEPDHSGVLPDLVNAKPDVTVIGHPMAEKLIRSQYGVTVKFKPVKDGEEVEVSGLRFSFYHTPWLHWPETIVSYLHSDGVLFTGDVFGSYGMFREKLLSSLSSEERDRYFKLARKYFANVVGHYREFVLRSLNRLVELIEKSEYIAPAHGLVLEKSDALIMAKLYEKWARSTGSKVLVVYDSMYGFIERFILELTSRLKSRDYEVSTHAFTWSKRSLISEVVGEGVEANALVIGVSLYENKPFPLIEYLVRLLVHKTGCKKTIIISAYGWGSRGAELKSLLESYGCREVHYYEAPPSGLQGLVEDVEKALLG
jgi:flavorubredoxin